MTEEICRRHGLPIIFKESNDCFLCYEELLMKEIQHNKIIYKGKR